MANLTPEAIVRRLVELSRMLDQATDDVDRLDDEAVRARAAHRVAYAEAFLKAEGPMDMRVQIATVKAEEKRFLLDIADQKVRACKERIRTIRDQIEVGRSLSAALRAEWAAS